MTLGAGAGRREIIPLDLVVLDARLTAPVQLEGFLQLHEQELPLREMPDIDKAAFRYIAKLTP
jgi:hypothetical protein